MRGVRAAIWLVLSLAVADSVVAENREKSPSSAAVELPAWIRDRAMLSFGLNGGGDFWERLIADDETIPPAFLVDLAEPLRTGR